jgi:hypothetical protein
MLQELNMNLQQIQNLYSQRCELTLISPAPIENILIQSSEETYLLIPRESNFYQWLCAMKTNLVLQWATFKERLKEIVHWHSKKRTVDEYKSFSEQNVSEKFSMTAMAFYDSTIEKDAPAETGCGCGANQTCKGTTYQIESDIWSENLEICDRISHEFDSTAFKSIANPELLMYLNMEVKNLCTAIDRKPGEFVKHYEDSAKCSFCHSREGTENKLNSTIVVRVCDECVEFYFEFISKENFEGTWYSSKNTF